eukprot:m.333029 g.333029  ORF g.333029 m.333029 type:complete len:274 (-) comp17049_c0_seq1:31-852(-)
MAFFNRLTMAGFGFAGAAFVADQILFDVDGGEAAVIFDKISGVQDKVLGEGMHFRIPFLQDPKIYNIRLDNRLFENPTQSKDLQNVSIGLRVLFRPDVDKLPDIFKQLGESERWADLVMRSITQEVLKSVIATYDAEQLITMRELISQQVRQEMVARGEKFNIVFDDVAIVELQFARDFNQAVEQKQVAQQEAERAKFLVDKAEQEKQARIIRAEGDSEAAELLGQAVAENGSGIIELRKIEAAREIAATMSRSRNVAYLPGGNNLLLNLNVN